MRTLFLLFSLLSIFYYLKEDSSLQNRSSENVMCPNDSLIYWNANRKLKWSDFQGSPSKYKTYVDKGYVAMTRPRLSVIPDLRDSVVILNISNIFLRYESWSLKEYQTSLLLSHEQGHFDINEISKRRIVKEIKQLPPLSGNYTIKQFKKDLHNIT